MLDHCSEPSLPREAVRLNADTFPRSAQECRLFAEAGITVTAVETVEQAAEQDLLASASALLVVSAKVRAEVIAGLSCCRVIARYGIGTDNIDIAAATAAGILVTNVPDFCVTEVADHTMALLLGTVRKLRLMDRATRAGQWQARVQEPVRRVAGRMLGLIGFGRTAREVAHRARGFGLEVIAYDPNWDRAAAGDLGVRQATFEEILRASDFVSLHLPLTPMTYHLIGENQFRSMKPSAIFLNTARGGIVDEAALVQALSSGWIAGAGVDVYETLAMFDPAPGRTDHPLFTLDNVLLTPHSAGCSEEALEDLMRDGAQQAITALQGRWPSNCVNPSLVPRFPLEVASRAGTWDSR